MQRQRKRLAVILAGVGLTTAMLGTFGRAEAAELLSFGSRPGMAVTVLEKSGLDTTTAKAAVAFTRENAKTYCLEFMKSEAVRCVDVSMARLKFPEAVTADCEALTFVDLEGTQLALDLERSPRKGRDYRIVDLRTGRQIHTESDYAAALDAFKLLCPARYGDLQEGPGCEVPGYEHLIACPAEALEPQRSLSSMLNATISIQCFVESEYQYGSGPTPGMSNVWKITLQGEAAWVNGMVVPVQVEPDDSSIISLRVIDIVAPDPNIIGTVDPGQRQLFSSWRVAMTTLMARAGVDRLLAIRVDTGQAYFYDRSAAGPQNIVQANCL